MSAVTCLPEKKKLLYLLRQNDICALVSCVCDLMSSNLQNLSHRKFPRYHLSCPTNMRTFFSHLMQVIRPGIPMPSCPRAGPDLPSDDTQQVMLQPGMPMPFCLRSGPNQPSDDTQHNRCCEICRRKEFVHRQVEAAPHDHDGVR